MDTTEYLDAQCFWNNFFDTMKEQIKNDKMYEVQYVLRFLQNIYQKREGIFLNTGIINTCDSFCQPLEDKTIWKHDDIMFLEKRLYIIYSVNSYEAFKVIKKLLDMENHECISKEEIQLFMKSYVDPNYSYIQIFMFSINKLLFNIFNQFYDNYENLIKKSSAFNNFEQQIDKFTNEKKINYLQYTIRQWCNPPEKKMFEMANRWKLISNNPYCNNFESYVEVHDYLYKFYNAIKQQSRVPEQQTNRTRVSTRQTKSKKKPIPKPLRSAVWNENLDPTMKIGNCFVCNCEIKFETFHCGHIRAEANGGETILENLKPICSDCNSSMGTMYLPEFKEKFIKTKLQDNQRYTIQEIIEHISDRDKLKFIDLLIKSNVFSLRK